MVLAGTTVYESGSTGGLPVIQGKFQLLFLDVSLPGEGSLLVSPRFFPLVDFDFDLIFKAPALISPSPSAGCVGLEGEVTNASCSSSSPLHISPNLDA